MLEINTRTIFKKTKPVPEVAHQKRTEEAWGQND
jgi:hypothetical protein